MGAAAGEAGDDGPSLPLAGRERVLEHATELILEAWRSFDRARPGQPLPGERHIELLSRPLPAEPSDPTAALDAAADVLDVSLAQARPRWFAYIGSSGLEIGVLGDALMASHDVNVATSSGAAELVEDQTIRWVGQFVGFDEDAHGLMAAGGTISNLTALTAARERAAPGVRRHGMSAQRMALYCSEEAHYSVRRAAEVLGIGADNVRAIPITRPGRHMDSAACAQAIDRDRAAGVVPVAVVATSGTTLTGAVDRLDELADVCSARGVWLHVDGAYGLPAAATARAGGAFRGLERADSATVDAHKWLYVPKSCSVLLVHDADALVRAFSHHEGYIPHEESLHAVDRTLEYSRPLSALKLWLAFTVHGADRIRAAIERNLEEAELLAALLAADERFELLMDPPLSVVCFRRVCGDAAACDEHQRELARALVEDGRLLIAPAEADGATWLRACFVNHRTTEQDVRAIPEVVGEVSDALLAGRVA
ncbi:MAG TPA: pyridoxal-dependent decarboxylase [Solirubrobacteraceae bacterium]|nr:pyridoxal-dependent decarboxylase [Solirubrobacteraceae bacterium]